MFYDIHKDEELEEETEEDKISRTIFDEMLYADDAIIYSRNSETLTKLFHKIQEEGKHTDYN